MEAADLRVERAQVFKQAREILDKAENEKRDLNGEEQGKYDGLIASADGLKKRIDRLEALSAEERALAVVPVPQTQPARPGAGAAADEHAGIPTNEERAMAMAAWFKAATSGAVRITDEERAAAAKCSINLADRNATFTFLAKRAPRHTREMTALEEARSESFAKQYESRALTQTVGPQCFVESRAQATSPTSAGGFLIAAEAPRAIEEAMLEFGGMRQVSNVIRTDTGAQIPIPTNDDTAQKGVILAENTAVAEQDLVFGQLTLDAYKYSSKMIRVSVELMQDSAINLAEFIGRKLAERLARIHNQHFTTGTGTGQPMGVVTASTLGKTGATGQTTTVIYDDLVDLVHAVDPAYRANGRFMFNDASMAKIRKIKDANNLPLFTPGFAYRAPDTILGYPITVNQDMAVMGTSAKSILFGDFNKYWIRDVREITLLRLDERYADFHQVAFLAFSRNDGDLMNTAAVKHYINSAS
jgi:HK97 family phage major capsid protein